MVSKIWTILIFIGVVFSFLTGKLDELNTTIIDSTKVSLDMLFKIFPVLALWMGLTKIAEKSNLLNKLSNKLSPFLKRLFPEIPVGHESLGFIASNMISNIFGLGSAATPFGLKAMSSLQELNKNKDTASRSMITFLVINTSGLTIIPTTIISLRMMYDSVSPTGIVFACIISTFFSTMGGIIVDRFLARRNKN